MLHTPLHLRAVPPAEVDPGDAVEAVIEAGRRSAERGWVPATSGNFSVRIDARRFAATRSGVDKGALKHRDVLLQDLDGPLLDGSSAEAELHRALYRADPQIGAIFHGHPPYSTVLSAVDAAAGRVRLSGWELQKALAGVKSHETTVEVAIFANDQAVPALADRITARLAAAPAPGVHAAPGYLLAGHGLYAWGRTPAEAFRHFEALETLFAQVLLLRSVKA